MTHSKGARGLHCASAAAALLVALGGRGASGPSGLCALSPQGLPPATGRPGAALRLAKTGKGAQPHRSALYCQQPQRRHAGHSAQEGDTRRGSLAALLSFGIAAAFGVSCATSAAEISWDGESVVEADMAEMVDPAKDLQNQIPALSEGEVRRRRTSPSIKVKDEKWFKLGKRAFNANCSGCHAAGRQTGNQNTLLSTEQLESSGFIDPKKIQFIIRYGSNKMPGYAADCADVGSYGQCQSVIPLSEERLRDVQDYVLNRAASGWDELPK